METRCSYGIFRSHLERDAILSDLLNQIGLLHQATTAYVKRIYAVTTTTNTIIALRHRLIEMVLVAALLATDEDDA